MDINETIENFLSFVGNKKYKTIYADPPWQFQNRTGKVAPEHKRLNRYSTMTFDEIKQLPVSDVADEKSHLYKLLSPENLGALAPRMNGDMLLVVDCSKQPTITTQNNS